MSSLDAAFIAAEDAVNHMHTGSVGIFEGPAPTYETLRALVAAKLELIPRYRWRVREAPASIGRPLWVDDVDFDLDSQLRHTALPSGDRFGLQQLVGRVMSHPVDRRHPLWELWLIEGLGRGRWALLSKVHQCMVDGTGGGDLLTVITDHEAAAGVPAPAPWYPVPEPSRVDLARYTGEMTIESIADAVRGGLRLVHHPARVMDRARGLAVGVARAVVPGRRAGTSLTGPIGPRRRWARTDVALDDVHAIGRAFGGTVNAVALAAVTRGFRDLLRARGELTVGRTITTRVDTTLVGSPVSMLQTQLPIGIADAVATLDAVRASMEELDASHAIDASTAVLGGFGADNVQTVVTNVPGANRPLYVCGRRMLEAYAYAPIAGQIRIAVAIRSYRDQLYFAITGDWKGAADIERLAHGIDLAFEDLLKEAARRADRRPVGGIG